MRKRLSDVFDVSQLDVLGVSAKRVTRYIGIWSLLCLVLVIGQAAAHGISGTDAAFVAQNNGTQIIPFMYLGAKHMVTGYDHVLFILGVIFFLYSLKQVALYVTLFSVGHSITLLTGVLNDVRLDPHLIDAVIGLSVAYKAFDNLGGFQSVFGWQPEPRVAVFMFGLIHGFGLATKLQDVNISSEGLLMNMVSFNVGVEVGQLLVLSVLLAFMAWWRGTSAFARYAVVANKAVLVVGLMLIEYQFAGFMLQRQV